MAKHKSGELRCPATALICSYSIKSRRLTYIYITSDLETTLCSFLLLESAFMVVSAAILESECMYIV